MVTAPAELLPAPAVCGAAGWVWAESVEAGLLPLEELVGGWLSPDELAAG